MIEASNRINFELSEDGLGASISSCNQDDANEIVNLFWTSFQHGHATPFCQRDFFPASLTVSDTTDYQSTGQQDKPI
jgi:hypothetical protein